VFNTTPGVKSVANFYRENSFGKLSVTPAFTGGSHPGIVSVTVADDHPDCGQNFDYLTETTIISHALAWAKDTAGNVSQGKLAVVAIEQTAPVPSAPGIPAYYNKLNVPLVLKATGQDSAKRLSGNASPAAPDRNVEPERSSAPPRT